MRIQPRHILWPTDFSELSLRAAPYARAFCEAFGATLHVIHVATPMLPDNVISPYLSGGEPLATIADTLDEIKKSMRLLIKRRFPRLPVSLQVLAGSPWHEICQYADREEIDLIVLATHGATGLKHLVMGSVAEHVVQHAPCPVLTVKSFVHDFVEENPKPDRVKIIQPTVGEYAINPDPSEESASI